MFESYCELHLLRGEKITFPDLESYFRLKYEGLNKDFKWFFVKVIIRVDFLIKEWKREHRQSQSRSGGTSK